MPKVHASVASSTTFPRKVLFKWALAGISTIGLITFAKLKFSVVYAYI